MVGEELLNVIYDVVGKGIFFECNGRSHYLEGPFPNKKKALEAALLFCKSKRCPTHSAMRDKNHDS